MNQQAKEKPTEATAGGLSRHPTDSNTDLTTIIPHPLQEIVTRFYFDRGVQLIKVQGPRSGGDGKRAFDRDVIPTPEAAVAILESGDNIGVLCTEASGVIVIDVDRYAKDDSLEARHRVQCLDELIDNWHEAGLTETFTVLTGSGGYHFYYQYEPGLGCVTGSDAGRGVTGVDVRSKGGYVVAPPSSNAKGEYVIDNEAPIAPLPRELKAWLRQNGYYDRDAKVVKDAKASVSHYRAGVKDLAPRHDNYPADVLHAALAEAEAEAREVLAKVAALQRGHRETGLAAYALQLAHYLPGGWLAEDDLVRRLFDAAGEMAEPLPASTQRYIINSKIRKGKDMPEYVHALETGDDATAKEYSPKDPDAAFNYKLEQQKNKRSISPSPSGNGNGGRPAPEASGKADRLGNDPERVKAFLRDNYTLAWDTLSDNPELGGEQFDEVTWARIDNACRSAGCSASKVITNSVIEVAAERPHHPVRDYLEATVYQGAKIREIAEMIKIRNDGYPDAPEIFLTRWMVGAVARAYTGSQNFILVLEGAQGIGKSRFARWICPTLANDPANTKRLFDAAPINPDRNDDNIKAANIFVWEVSEIPAITRKHDREAVKAFTTRETYNMRMPYARKPVIKMGLANFIGTANNEAGFLNDPTGSRRFVVLPIDSIDSAIFEQDPGPLWAEAYDLWQNGASPFITPDEAEMQAALNAEFQTEPQVSMYLFDIIEITGKADDFVPSRAIIERLGDDGYTPAKNNPDATAKNVHSIMQRLGINETRHRTNNKQPRGFEGIRLLPISR